jgi:hypothetical protein
MLRFRSSATALLIFVSTTIFAQMVSTGRISGRVTDSSGAVLPGVEVTVTDTGTGLTRTGVTNETGSYTLPNLPVGPYRLEMMLPGFRTFVQTGIVLQVNANIVIDGVLQVGDVTQSVEVQANVETMVETRNLGIGQLIENERILELPLNARDVTSLITLSGAAVQTTRSPTFGMDTGVNISVAGGLPFGVAYLLDGAAHTNPYDATGMPIPFPDALQEFRVQTSTQSADTGRASGAAVTAVTKSGTNAVHGDLFWFVRNAVFNAKDADARVKNQLKRNQFGGVVGGPIVKNKLFFFAGYQGTALRQTPTSTLAIVPTAAMLAGDWTAFNQCYRPTWRIADFANGFVDPSRYSKAAKYIASQLPTTSDPCGQVRFGSRSNRDDKQGVGRIDYQQSARHTIFGRYMATKQVQPASFPNSNLLEKNIAGVDDFAQSAIAGSTYVISPKTINSLRLAFNRFGLLHAGNQFFSASEAGINIWSDPEVPKYFNLAVTGAFTIGGGTNARKTQTMKQIQAGDDVSLIRGTHQILVGGAWSRTDNDSVGHVRSVGNLTVNAQVTGNAMGDFLLGNLTQMRQSMPNPLDSYQYYIGGYAADTWRATPRLTLNYGVRWEPFFPQVMKPGDDKAIRIYSFDAARFKQGLKSTVFPAAPAGFIYPGDPGFIGQSGMNTGWRNLAPRAGLAWDPTGDGRTSIRAGYGIAYDVVSLQLQQNMTNVAPWSNDTIYAATSLDDPWRGFPGGNPFPYDWSKGAKFFAGSVFIPTPPNLHSTYVNSWNVSLQRQIGAEWLVSASYVGSGTVHAWGLRAANGATFLTPQNYPALFSGPNTCVLEGVTYTPCNQQGNIDQRRELRMWTVQNNPALLNDAKLFSFVDEYNDGSTASYNGLLLSTRGRFRGLNVNTNYTWSHCISDFFVAGVANNATTPLRGRDRGPCNSDRRHLFNLTVVAGTPQFSNRALHAVASDWRLSAINRISSGTQLTIGAGADQAQFGITARADQILSNTYVDTSGKLNSQFLNPAAFAVPALGSVGNLGPYAIRGPGLWSLDAALARSFRLTESKRFEVRAEAFNVTNSVQPMDPVVNRSSPNFGKVTTLQTARVMQFALKVVY